VAPGLRLVVVVLLVLAQTGPYFLSVGYVSQVPWAPRCTHGCSCERYGAWRSGSGSRCDRAFPFASCSRSRSLLSTDLLYATIGLTDVVLLAHYRDSAAVGALRAVQPVAALNQVAFSSFLILFTPVIGTPFRRATTRTRSRTSTGKREMDRHRDATGSSLVTLVLARPVTGGFLRGAIRGVRVSARGALAGLLHPVAFGFNGTTLMVFGRLRTSCR